MIHIAEGEKKHLQGVHQLLPFSCGACDVKEDKEGGWKRLQVFRLLYP
jgi:hypothetical protein